MVAMRGGITGVGNNRPGPVNAALWVSEAEEPLIGGWLLHLERLISTSSGTGAGGGGRTARCSCPRLEGLGGGIGPAAR